MRRCISKKGLTVSIFTSDKLTTSPMHGTSGDLWLQLNSLAMLLTHILKDDLKAFLEDIKDNDITKYSRGLHPHDQLVIMLTFVERTLNLLC